MVSHTKGVRNSGDKYYVICAEHASPSGLKKIASFALLEKKTCKKNKNCFPENEPVQVHQRQSIRLTKKTRIFFFIHLYIHDMC